MTSVTHMRLWETRNKCRDRWIVFLPSGTFFCALFIATPVSIAISIPPPTREAQKLCKELGFCEELRWHVLMLNNRGRLFGIEELRHRSIALPGGSENLSEEVGPEHDPRYYRKARGYIRPLLRHASELSTATDAWRAVCRERGEEYVAYPKDGKRRILIFVHGGLNSVDGSLDRTNRLYIRILCTGAYPIFINWNSGLWSSYAEHLFSIRQGHHHNFLKDRLPGLITFPFYLIADVAGSVVKSPLSTGQLGINDTEASRMCPPLRQRKADWLCGDEPAAAAHYLNKEFQWNIVMAEDTRSFGEEVLDTARLLISQPTKTLAAAVAVQAGAEAWTDMLRRIDVTFRTGEDFQLPVFMLSADRTPKDVSARIRPTVFGLQEGKEPTTHGDFSSLWKFRKEECWMPGASLDACNTKVEEQ